MKMHLKLISVLVLFTLLLTMFIACEDKSDNQSSTDTTSNDDSAADDVTEVAEVDKHAIEKGDYDGRDFVIMYPNVQLYRNFTFSEEISGDVVNDAIYQRDQEIGEYLNINITTHQVPNIGDYYQPLLNVVQAGDSDYDMLLTHCHADILNIVKMNLVMDWNKIDYIDLSKPYWNQEINSLMEIAGALPYAVNDFIIPDVLVLFFNKLMAENYQLEDIYQLVRDGTWTWDKMIEMCEVVVDDLNGNGVYGEAEDQVGLYTMTSWQLNSYQTAADIYTVSKVGDELVFTLNSERTVSFIEKMEKLLLDKTLSYNWPHSGTTDVNQGGVPPVKFEEGRALFCLLGSTAASMYREAELDFGIIPMPKFSETQDNYRSLTWAGFMCIPQTVSDPDLVGKVAELLGYYNRKDVLPEFFEKQLRQKVARDTESADMLDIIYDNVVLDFGVVLSMSGVTDDIIRQGANFVSYYEKRENIWNKSLESYIEAFVDYADINNY